MDGNTIFVCLSFCWEEQLFLFSFAPPYTVHSFRTLMCIIHLAAREKVSVLCLPGRTKYSALLKSLCNNPSKAKTHRLASRDQGRTSTVDFCFGKPWLVISAS
jgi:hypothetical protein